MKQRTIYLWVILLLCGCGSDLRQRSLWNRDITPPCILHVEMTESNCLEIHFDESLGKAETTAAEGTVATRTLCTDEKLQFFFQDNVVPGQRYRIRFSVEDESGNRLNAALPFYGYNRNPAKLRMEEFTPQGGGNHPDWVEFYITQGGDMGGTTFYAGTPSDHEWIFIFPSFRVETGDFILLHTQPEGIAEEINEVFDLTASGGKDSCETARDFWNPTDQGLPSNNGILCLSSRPYGKVTDAVVYSNRSPGGDNGGFVSFSFYENVQNLITAGEWSSPGTPQQAIDPEPSTATRSLCRHPGLDTNSKEDWYVTIGGGASPGRPNTAEEFTPET